MRGAPRTALAAAALLAIAAAGQAAAQVRDWPSRPVPKPLATRAASLPPYEVRTLANGLRVVAVEHHEQPLVSLRLLVGAGTARDAMPKLGVANMVASLLDQGTASRSAQQIAQTIDSIGGQLDAFTAKEYASYYVKVLDEHLSLAIDLLMERIRDGRTTPAHHQIAPQLRIRNSSRTARSD
mgnify:CR=1 FL=1